MKHKIELEIELPRCCKPEFFYKLSLLSEKDLMLLECFVEGILVATYGNAKYHQLMDEKKLTDNRQPK